MTRVLVIPLGETDRTQVERAVRAHFPGAQLDWANRRDLTSVQARRYADAVLVAADLDQPRLRLTSVLLALTRAQRRWRMDLRGRCEPFHAGGHIGRNALPVARHALALAVARLAAEPLLRLIERGIRRDAARVRRLQPARVTRAPDIRAEREAGTRTETEPVTLRDTTRQSSRAVSILYLRAQLWLGLEGGGSVAHTAGVINGLEEAGARVQVVASDRLPGVHAPVHVIKPETWFDGARRELEELAYNVSFLQAACAKASAWRPNAIYQRHTTFNVAGAVLARLFEVPLVLEFNSSELWKGTYWGGLHHRKAAEVVERINLAAADRIVVVSRVLRDQLVAQGVAAEKIRVNPNAVDPRQFRPDLDGRAIRQRYTIDPAEIVIGFSGTFGLWHGIPTLAQAIQTVTQARWLLVGDGPQRHLVEPPRAHVTLTGLVPHAEMPAHLAACDILVSPHARQADGGEFFGSPTKLYEYMAMGKPIVASAVGQIADVLEDGHSALLVPPDNPDALAEAVKRLIDAPDLRERLGRAARELALAQHTWLRNARSVLACLEQ